MQKIGHVLLAGAGAVGMLHAVKLARCPGVDFRLAADGARRERYRREGLFFNGERKEFRFAGEGEFFRPEIILVATKFGQFAEALEMLAPYLTAGTIFLPLLNGISASTIARKRFPSARVLDGFFLGHASMREGTSVRHDGVGATYLGECGATTASDALRATEELFFRAGIPCKTPPDMTAAIWKKFILNVGVNQSSAFFGADYGELREDPEKIAFAEALMLEALAVAEAEKIAVGREAVDAALDVIRSMPPRAKTSMLQDAEKSRPTEVALFAGEIRRRGAAHGIPTPENDRVWARFGEIFP
ncbi:MAG: ketopantoate reductase family protein [Victivallaceae bacterium]|nr:ketopantoate reductase family protein [Victivallaceae bacterium]